MKTFLLLVLTCMLIQSASYVEAKERAKEEGRNETWDMKNLIDVSGHIRIPQDANGSINWEDYAIQIDPEEGPIAMPMPPICGWDNLGAGLNAKVNAIAFYGGQVVVGGDFTDAGGNPDADYLAVWNGMFWTTIGGVGLNAPVHCLTVGSGGLYIGGEFTNAGGNPLASKITRWDGVWNSFGGVSPNNTVRVITLIGLNTYVGGSFTSIGGISNTKGIGVWDGISWTAMGTGLSGPFVSVFDIINHSTGIVVGGVFENAGGNADADNIALWSGGAWYNLGIGLNGQVFALGSMSGTLYAGGSFTDAGGVAGLNYFAKWNGSAWSALGGAVDGPVFEIATIPNEIYIGGIFNSVSGVPFTDRLAYFNEFENSWLAVGGGVSGTVHAIQPNAGKIYMGGSYIGQSGNPNANNIAFYDISTIDTFTYNNLYNNQFSYAGNWSCFQLPPRTLSGNQVIALNTICNLRNQTIGANATLWMKSGSTVHLPSDSTLIQYGIFNNNGQFTNYGILDSYLPSSMDNYSFFTNNGLLRTRANFTNAGNMVNNGVHQIMGQATNLADWSNNQKMSIEADGFFSNGGAAFFNIQTNDSLDVNAMGTLSNYATLSNKGFFNIKGQGQAYNYGTWVNIGQMDIRNNGVLHNHGTIHNSGTVTNHFGGTIKGSGTFISTGVFVNNGTISPGASPGVLTIDGTCDLGTGTLEIELDGIVQNNEYDLLAVTSAATTTGTLKIIWGFTPTVGDQFIFLTSASRTGSFTTVTHVNEPSGFNFVVIYGLNSVKIVVDPPLPVELSDFTAKALDGSIDLRWTTASETNNKGFFVERSPDGKNWDVIGFVEGLGTSLDWHTYTFADRKPISGLQYYRLRQTDIDGTIDYSSVVSALWKTLESVYVVYPNPSYGTLQVDYATSDALLQIQLWNLHGEMVGAWDRNANQEIDASHLPKGQYVIKVLNGSGLEFPAAYFRWVLE